MKCYNIYKIHFDHQHMFKNAALAGIRIQRFLELFIANKVGDATSFSCNNGCLYQYMKKKSAFLA